jgi:hypothetical protein
VCPFASEGVEKPETFTAGKISGIRILFVSSAELRKKLQNLYFEKSE